MRLIKKITILSMVCTIGILPSFAQFEAGVSQNNFYDTEKTVMTKISPNENVKTGKYWSNNPFYSNKYRPLFMLSNKELYDLMPKENISIVQRINTPSIYNISLKTSSIIAVSLNPIKSANLPITSKPKTVIYDAKKAAVKTNEINTKLISQYEQAKNPQTESEAKIEAALSLKNSQNAVHQKLAIDLLDDVTKKEPYNAYAFYLKGETYSQLKNSENAIKNYIEALKLNPTSKQCYLGIARILESTNKLLAQKYYEKAEHLTLNSET